MNFFFRSIQPRVESNPKLFPAPRCFQTKGVSSLGPITPNPLLFLIPEAAACAKRDATPLRLISWLSYKLDPDVESLIEEAMLRRHELVWLNTYLTGRLLVSVLMIFRISYFLGVSMERRLESYTLLALSREGGCFRKYKKFIATQVMYLPTNMTPKAWIATLDHPGPRWDEFPQSGDPSAGEMEHNLSTFAPQRAVGNSHLSISACFWSW